MDTAMVLFGVTGDLSRRKLLPALLQVGAAGQLPPHFKVIGVSRQDIDADNLLNTSFGSNTTSFEAAVNLRRQFEVLQVDPANLDDFHRLADRLKAIKADWPDLQVLYYISVPPQVSLPIIENLGRSGLAAWPDAKLLLEKPFGTDLESAGEIVEKITPIFKESQIFRIDHYLAKEMAQNIAIFLHHNPLFQKTWDNRFIESIEVVAYEEIGIEGRAAFYEQTGALRDVMQSHLLQLLALILYDPTGEGTDEAVKRQRCQALKQVRPANPMQAIRGQYIGYKDEVNNSDSSVETFAAVTLESDDPRWQGVPLLLRTGKCLNRKRTEIRVCYRTESDTDPNMLIFRLQPNEGVELQLWVKTPGYERGVDRAALDFAYASVTDALPEAYEQVLVEAIADNRTLFASGEEVIESWRILEPVQRSWEMQGADNLVLYPHGANPNSDPGLSAT